MTNENILTQGGQLAEEEARIVRQTDNTRKENDLEAPQDTNPLELDENGVPVGFKAGE